MAEEIQASKGRNNWHAISAEAALRLLESTPEGLSNAEVELRRRRYGGNTIPRAKPEGPLDLILRQICNPLIYTLLISAAVALAMRKVVDGAVVLGVVVLNALIGFIQEWKASRAIAALNDLVPEMATVIRGGTKVSVPAQALVPGDLIMVSSGDKIPADCRVLSSTSLLVVEGALTGESVPVNKHAAEVPEDAVLGERASMLYGGTFVSYGTGGAVVTATGEQTELGKISSLLHQTTRIETPLTRSLLGISRTITIAIIVISLLLFTVALWRGFPLVDALLAAITLAVAAIPEGLPSIITIALAIGVKRMAKRKAIIRQLPAVETLGSTTVICSDKTGTLTKNEMTVKELWVAGESFQISGVGYQPDGFLIRDGDHVSEGSGDISELLICGALCNDAVLHHGPYGNELAGDPTEGALLVVAEKLGIAVAALRHAHPRRGLVPFESERQFMASLHEEDADNSMLYLKGAPEVVITHCSKQHGGTPFDAQAAQDAAEELARRGMRVLAFAASPTAEMTADSALREVGTHFTFLGLQGMIDPPRPEAIASISTCQRAGIQVKMITGDHQGTAQAVAAELGLLNESGVIGGAELSRLTDLELAKIARRVNVFARVAPEHKLRLVQALQAQNEVVAMTGDGVNDAPALKQANIGVAMGVTGTAVSKEAADIVLTNDNFASIGAAVEEGRHVYDNLIKSLAFVLPTNLGEAMIILVAVFFFPVVNNAVLMPMLPVQILWINLVATVTLALPLAFEAMEPNIMRRPPRDPSTPLLSFFIIQRTLVVTVLVTIGGIGLFWYEYIQGVLNDTGRELALREAQTLAVTTVVLMQIFYLFNCRSLRDSVLKIGLFSNWTVYLGVAILLLLQLGFVYLPQMNQLLHSAPLGPNAWIKATLTAAIVLPVVALEKQVRNFAIGGSGRTAPHQASSSSTSRPRAMR